MSAPDLRTARWIKSSFSTNNGVCVELAFLAAGTRWIKSSHSTNNGDCIELAIVANRVAARDSKNSDGPVLAFPTESFHTLLRRV
ncbi:DUF397 domain-containing protein [Actinokineospora sp.]|uniref:DUF397 domain-containing protein n=1 Tax=Actinokineospora sp. TaxID=1872133 RepID=UPI004038264C